MSLPDFCRESRKPDRAVPLHIGKCQVSNPSVDLYLRIEPAAQLLAQCSPNGRGTIVRCKRRAWRSEVASARQRTLQRLVQTGDQAGFVERLAEKAERAGVERLPAQPIAWKRGHEDHRGLMAVGEEPAL